MKKYSISIVLCLCTAVVCYFIFCKTVIYDNPKITYERFLTGKTINEFKDFNSSLSFYYIFKFGNCSACNEEMQYMNRIYNKFKEQIEFKGIMASCGDPDLQQRFIRGSGLKYDKIIVDDNFNRWLKYGFEHYPVKVITNSKGKVLFADSLLYIPEGDTGKQICSKFENYLNRLTQN